MATPRQDTFLGEIIGAVALAGDDSSLKPTMKLKHIRVIAEGIESRDGQIAVDKKQGKFVKVLENLDPVAYYDIFANELGKKKQSAVVGSFNDQKRIWSTPPENQTEILLKVLG